MSPKSNFFLKVACEIEAAEKATQARPDHGRAKALRELRESLKHFPDDHALFKMGQNWNCSAADPAACQWAMRQVK